MVSSAHPGEGLENDRALLARVTQSAALPAGTWETVALRGEFGAKRHPAVLCPVRVFATDAASREKTTVPTFEPPITTEEHEMAQLAVLVVNGAPEVVTHGVAFGSRQPSLFQGIVIEREGSGR